MKRFLLALSLLVTASVGHTFQITYSGYLEASNQPGSVWYGGFVLPEADTVRIQSFAETFDSVLYLFKYDGVLDALDYLAHDDDGGGNLNSRIDRFLDAGAYMMALADFPVDLDEILAGINDAGSNPQEGFFDIEVITRETEVRYLLAPVKVPEPSGFSLILFAVIGLFLRFAWRRVIF